MLLYEPYEGVWTVEWQTIPVLYGRQNCGFLNEMRAVQCSNKNNSLDTVEIVKAGHTEFMI